MATLPTFVELMASLGLADHPSLALETSTSTTTTTPTEHKPSPSRSHSSPSLRETKYSSRYSPYLSPVRNDSFSSISSLSDIESPMDPAFNFPRRNIPLRPRKYRHKVSRSDSTSDIAGDTPISIYARRKTPGSSPITPNFDSGYESAVAPQQTPFSIPTLPVLLTNSAASSDIDSPTSDCDGQMAKDQNYYRFILQRTGTRISAARARREQIARRNAVAN